MIVFVILVIVALIGGIFAICKSGEKDGICKYGYKDGKNEQGGCNE